MIILGLAKIDHTKRLLLYLIVAEPLKWKTSEGDHLVKKDAVRPDVRHGGEEAVGQALRRHPPDREHALPAEAVVVVLVHWSGNEKSTWWGQKHTFCLKNPKNILFLPGQGGGSRQVSPLAHPYGCPWEKHSLC